MSQMQEFRLRFSQAPTSATASGSVKRNEGDSLQVKSSATMRDGKFSLRQSGRWHRVAATMVGPFELTGYQPKLRVKGQR
jgi:hypothetical protein